MKKTEMVCDLELKKLISQRYRNRIPEGFKCVAEISTNHMSEGDARIWMSGGDLPGLLGRYTYGLFFKTTDDPCIIEAYREHGLSAEFIHIMRFLHEHEIYYVCFDQDGPTVGGLKKFNW